MDKEFRCWVRDAIWLQSTQPSLTNVFQLLECIKMNMVEEWMVTLGFNNENPKNTSMYHRFNNLMASPISPCYKRSKGPSWNNMVSHRILLSKGERTSVGDVVGFIGKILILFRSLSPTLTQLILFSLQGLWSWWGPLFHKLYLELK